MDNRAAVKELVESDGRFRLVELGWFHLDPLEGPLRGEEPIFGAVLKGRVGSDANRPAFILPMSEEFADSDPELVARALLSAATGGTKKLFAG